MIYNILAGDIIFSIFHQHVKLNWFTVLRVFYFLYIFIHLERTSGYICSYIIVLQRILHLAVLPSHDRLPALLLNFFFSFLRLSFHDSHVLKCPLILNIALLSFSLFLSLFFLCYWVKWMVLLWIRKRILYHAIDYQKSWTYAWVTNLLLSVVMLIQVWNYIFKELFKKNYLDHSDILLTINNCL